MRKLGAESEGAASILGAMASTPGLSIQDAAASLGIEHRRGPAAIRRAFRTLSLVISRYSNYTAREQRAHAEAVIRNRDVSW